MSEQLLYLKPNVVVEPLFAKWYAWSHLIPPFTAGLNVINRHLSIIQSYISAPDVHAQAVLSPKLRGGPFMDFSGGRIEEVKVLLKETLQKQSKLIELAKAIQELDKLLSEASGNSLEKVYDEVPELLKGYVELYYDRNNNAGFRFFESLLYESEFYDKKYQSIALWITNNDQRPFCLSTPRLTENHVLHLEIPFDHAGIDKLSEMKRKPNKLSYIKAELGISKEQSSLFETFFTSSAPPEYKKYTGNKIRMRYFGHACILIETKETSILIDPLISYYGYHSEVDHFSDINLPETIDYALITHNHQDHILFETLLPLRHKIKKIIVPGTNSGKLEDPDLRLMFKNIGFDRVHSIAEMESIQFEDITVTGLPFTGEHSDLNILTKCCYLVQIGGFKLLFVADSRIIVPELYKHIRRQTGDIDVVFLGMECDGAPLSWLYGPLMPNKPERAHDLSRRLSGSDCEKGMSLVNIFNPSEVYVYAMGQEPWVEFISSIKYTNQSNPIVQSNKLVDLCTEKGIIAERLYGEKELLYER